MRIFDIVGRAGRLIAGNVSGRRVTVRRRRIVVDGRVVSDDLDEEVQIRIVGGDGQLSIDAGGDVVVEGDVANGVRAGMNVRCGNVSGDVEAAMSIDCQDVGGDASAGMDLTARDIAGRARAGMDVNAKSVGR